MMGIIKDTLILLFKWTMIALVVVICLRLITYFVPWASQANIKQAISGGDSVVTTKSKSWFPTPGDWSTDIVGDGGKFKPILLSPNGSGSYDLNSSNGVYEFVDLNNNKKTYNSICYSNTCSPYQ